VYSGARCYIYLENGQILSQQTISAIASEFTNTIYPNDVAAFGSEPDVDNDPRIYILLSKFREPAGNSYIAGYFFSLNESTSNFYSNRKEMFYMNINKAISSIDPTSTQFFNVLAHEFQHMIHWAHKPSDDTWLNEAMSEVARTYCGYGPSLDRLAGFSGNPTHSLTQWDGTLNSYYTVYMWAQYFRDTFADDIFKKILSNSFIGIDSVHSELTASYSTDFTSTFKDWSLALASEGSTTWKYSSFAPIVSKVTLTTLPLTLPAMTAWSLGFYDRVFSSGSVTWTASSPAERASFISIPSPDPVAGIAHYDLSSGSTYTYVSKGRLITQNVSTVASGGGSAVFSSPKLATPDIILTPSQMLEQANLQMSSQNDPQPQPICIQPWLAAKEAEIRSKGAW
jgi:hypothetical protein